MQRGQPEVCVVRMDRPALEPGMLSDRSGDRTRDLKIKSLLLYQLSYPVDILGTKKVR